MKTEATNLHCKLTAPEMQKRKASVIADLKTMIQQQEELANGFKFKFENNDTALDKLMDFVKSERLCCEFFTFQITVEQNFAYMAITGPVGAKEFLKQELEFGK